MKKNNYSLDININYYYIIISEKRNSIKNKKNIKTTDQVYRINAPTFFLGRLFFLGEFNENN